MISKPLTISSLSLMLFLQGCGAFGEIAINSLIGSSSLLSSVGGRNSISQISNGRQKIDLSFTDLKLKETRGNGDDIANQGESINILPIFRNNPVYEKDPEPVKSNSDSAKDDSDDSQSDDSVDSDRLKDILGDFFIVNEKPKNTFSTKATITNDISSLRVSLSSSSSYVTINNDEISIGSIRNGQTSSSLSESFSMRLKSRIPENTSIPLTFSISDNYGNSWRASSSVTVRKINNSFVVSDLNLEDVYGNGDKIANRGERIELTPEFYNTGASATNNLTINFSTNSTYVQASDRSFYLGKIRSGSSITANTNSDEVISLQLSKSTPEGAIIPLKFYIKDDYLNEWQIQKDLKVEKIDNKFVIGRMETQDITGNGDIFANRGETIKVIPHLRNDGGSPSNPLNINFKVNSNQAISAKTDLRMSAIGAKNTLSTLPGFFDLSLDKNTIPGNIIPVVFNISDDFGNSWNIGDKVTVLPMAGKLSISNLEIFEITGNNDKRPSKGEKISLKAYFSNISISRTNPMNVTLSSLSDYVKVIDSNSSKIVALDKTQRAKLDNDFTIEISPNTPTNTTAPLLFKFEDEFNNQFEVLENIEVN